MLLFSAKDLLLLLAQDLLLFGCRVAPRPAFDAVPLSFDIPAPATEMTAAMALIALADPTVVTGAGALIVDAFV